MRGVKTFWGWLKKLNANPSYIEGILPQLGLKLLEAKDPRQSKLIFGIEESKRGNFDQFEDMLGFRVYTSE
jgi:hypothetical protein